MEGLALILGEGGPELVRVIELAGRIERADGEPLDLEAVVVVVGLGELEESAA